MVSDARAEGCSSCDGKMMHCGMGKLRMVCLSVRVVAEAEGGSVEGVWEVLSCVCMCVENCGRGVLVVVHGIRSEYMPR